MESQAVILERPRRLSVESVKLRDLEPTEIVVDVLCSGVSTGTERLFWTGEMPPFPGMGYPLVPGYETLGEVVDVGAEANLVVGDVVFAPGADCYDGARGLFGGASSRIVSSADRVVALDRGYAEPDRSETGVLLALAATARHALAQPGALLPDLIVGHGALGRLLARLTLAAGGKPPVVWERDSARREGADGYAAICPETDDRRDYGCIYDASGDSGVLDDLVGRLSRGGEIVLAGFYPGALSLNFAPAFMREARLRIAAEWTRADLLAVRSLVESGALSLEGLVSHRRPASAAPEAYETAFADPACLKMVLDWRSGS